MASSNPNSLLKTPLKLLCIGVLDYSSQSMQSSLFFLSGLSFFNAVGSLKVSTLLELSLGREELHTVGLLISPAGLTSVEPSSPRSPSGPFSHVPQESSSPLDLVASLDG